jgi:hypothetical protein
MKGDMSAGCRFDSHYHRPFRPVIPFSGLGHMKAVETAFVA